MGIPSVDSCLLKHLEFHCVSSNKLANSFLIVWFLPSKLVAGESKNFKTPGMQKIVQLHELCVIPRGQTSFGGYIHNKAYVAFKGGKRNNFLGVDSSSRKLKDGFDLGKILTFLFLGKFNSCFH